MEFSVPEVLIVMRIFLAVIFSGLTGCFSGSNGTSKPGKTNYVQMKFQPVAKNNPAEIRTIHVFVALCDNKYQGIVPVGKSIGNGQDPANNLYWGCDYGVKTFFKKKNSDWIVNKIQTNISDTVLERILFKHKTENVYLLADAYNGKFIKQTTIDFLNATSGRNPVEINYREETLFFGGSSNLTAYIGHDGLMDFSLPLHEPANDTVQKETIILACYSKHFFSPHIKNIGAKPLLWTTHLMAPEAYTLHDALREWIAGNGEERIRSAAAQAYSKFQKCSFKAAKNLLVSGWD